MRIAVYFNPRARQGEQIAALREKIGSDQIDWIDLQTEAELPLSLSRAVAAGVERVIAAGGDGTVSAVTQAMAQLERPVPMGILPLGTGNDFSRTLRLPMDLEQAWEICLNGRILPIDLMRLRTNAPQSGPPYAVNMITAGNSGVFLDLLTDEMKKQWGPLCYARGLLDVVWNLTAFEADVWIDEEQLETRRWLNLFIANGSYSGGGMTVSPQADPADGLFEFVAIEDGPPLDLAALPANYLLGEMENHQLVTHRRGSRLRMAGSAAWPCTADGEFFEATDLDVEVLSQRVRFLVPNPAEEGADISAIEPSA